MISFHIYSPIPKQVIYKASFVQFFYELQQAGYIQFVWSSLREKAKFTEKYIISFRIRWLISCSCGILDFPFSLEAGAWITQEYLNTTTSGNNQRWMSRNSRCFCFISHNGVPSNNLNFLDGVSAQFNIYDDQNMCFNYLRSYLSRRFTNMWQPPIKLTCSRKEASSCFWETARITICRTSSIQAMSWLRSKKAMRDFISDAEMCCLHKQNGRRTSSKGSPQREMALFLKTKMRKLSKS